MRDPFAVVAQIGIRLERSVTGWRDAKALIMVAANSGGWAAGADLADALGIPPDLQENVYRELYPEDPNPPIERLGTVHHLPNRNTA